MSEPIVTGTFRKTLSVFGMGAGGGGDDTPPIYPAPGSNGEVIFNAGGVFGANPNFNYTPASAPYPGQLWLKNNAAGEPDNPNGTAYNKEFALYISRNAGAGVDAGFAPQIGLESFSDSKFPVYSMTRSMGGSGAGAALTAGEIIGRVQFRGFNGDTYAPISGAWIDALATNTLSETNSGVTLRLSVSRENYGAGDQAPIPAIDITDTLTTFYGAVRATGTFDEATTDAGVYSGIVGGAPRVTYADGTGANWQTDSYLGAFRWYQPGSVYMELSTTALAVTGDISATGNLSAANYPPAAGSLTVNMIEPGTAQYQYLVTGPGAGFVPAWSAGFLNIAAAKTLTISNSLTISGTDGATLALAVTTAKTLTLTATDNFNLTVPATGTAALLEVANVFTALNTLTDIKLSSGKIYPSANGTSALQFTKANGTTVVLNIDTTNEKVGIGTASPSAKLHIAGTDDDQQLIVKGNVTQTGNILEVHNSSNAVLDSFDGVGGAVFNEQGASAGDFRVESDNLTNIFFIDYSEDAIGIGTTAPAARLDMRGATTLLSSFSIAPVMSSTSDVANYSINNGTTFMPAPASGTLANLYGHANVLIASTSTATITNFYNSFFQTIFNANFAGTVDNYWGLRVVLPAIAGGTVSKAVGVEISEIEGSSSQDTNLLIGTHTIPSGQWSIYNASARDNYFAGNLKVGVVGKGLYIKEGSNATMGVATLVLGVAVVSTTKVTANSRIFLSVESLGTIATPVSVSVTARTAGTSFTITSANLTDTSVIAWVIMEPA